MRKPKKKPKDTPTWVVLLALGLFLAAVLGTAAGVDAVYKHFFWISPSMQAKAISRAEFVMIEQLRDQIKGVEETCNDPTSHKGHSRNICLGEAGCVSVSADCTDVWWGGSKGGL
jgi:hypothetical protein